MDVALTAPESASAHKHMVTESSQLHSLQVQSLALPVVVAWMEQEFRPAPVITLSEVPSVQDAGAGYAQAA